VGAVAKRESALSGGFDSTCPAGLEKHAARIETEAGHVLAHLIFGGNSVGVGSVICLAKQESTWQQQAAG
jgi:hypothetical protein